MKKSIKLLDLYCGAGGCAVGYFRAAKKLGYKIQIIGIDNQPQPNYPFQFIQADAIEYFTKHSHKFTHFHASPPCQKFTKGTAPFRKKGKIYDDFIEITRTVFESTGLTAVIENVPSAPIRADIKLRGDMFNLKVIRQRHFETINWFALKPGIPTKIGSVRNGDYCSIFGKGSYRNNKLDAMPKFKKETVVETWKHALDIDWMKTDKELSNSIPPAYTEYIGELWFNQTL